MFRIVNFYLQFCKSEESSVSLWPHPTRVPYLYLTHIKLGHCMGRDLTTSIYSKQTLDICADRDMVSSSSSVKPVTHLANLCEKSPGVPGAAMAIFADRSDRRYLACQISAINRHSPSVPRFFTFIAANRHLSQPIS